MYIIENGNIKREKLSGEIPPPLQEFAMSADEAYIYIHGGLMTTGKKSADLYRINRKAPFFRRVNLKDFCPKLDPLNDFFVRRASYHFKASECKHLRAFYVVQLLNKNMFKNLDR